MNHEYTHSQKQLLKKNYKEIQRHMNVDFIDELISTYHKEQKQVIKENL